VDGQGLGGLSCIYCLVSFAHEKPDRVTPQEALPTPSIRICDQKEHILDASSY
jgi:hypothetical protein